MSSDKYRVHPIYSLRFQLCAGAIGLLGLALAAVSYFLIEHQKQILTDDLQKAVILQGRNVALSSAKALLRPDSEFDLVPLVTRISEGSSKIESLVITNSQNTIQADMELQRIGQQFAPSSDGYHQVAGDLAEADETLLESPTSYMLRTPVTSLDETIGHVYMTYSKQELLDAIRQAVRITLVVGAVTFILGIVFSLLVFRRISQPLDVVVEGVNSLGQGNLDTRIRLNTRNEFRFLADSFNSMASTLKAAQADLISKELMDRELEIAHDIQSSLMPSNVVQPDGYEIRTYYKSAMQVGGDYVDAIPVDDTRIAIVMADVSGKGIPGLVVMAMLKIMVHDLIKKGLSPREVIRRLNTPLAANIRENMFVTMFLGVLDLESRELTFSNAAHNPILVYDHTEARCEFQRIPGRPLALFDDTMFCERLSEERLSLAAGDLFFLYTDGLNESRNHDGNKFGFDRIADVGKQHAAGGAKRLIDAMLEAERNFRGHLPPFDDLTLLAVRAKTAERSAGDVLEVTRSS